jgi:hypothetical protein
VPGLTNGTLFAFARGGMVGVLNNAASPPPPSTQVTLTGLPLHLWGTTLGNILDTKVGGVTVAEQVLQ